MLFVIRRNSGISCRIPNWWRSGLRCAMMNTDLVLSISGIGSRPSRFATTVFGERKREFYGRFGTGIDENLHDRRNKTNGADGTEEHPFHVRAVETR